MSPVLTQPLLRPGPSTPPALAVQALPEARPRYEATDPEPINPMRLTAWDDTHAASPVSSDEYLTLKAGKPRGQSDGPQSNGHWVRVVRADNGVVFAPNVAAAAKRLRLDPVVLRNRFRTKGTISEGGFPLRLERTVKAVELATATDFPDPEESDE